MDGFGGGILQQFLQHVQEAKPTSDPSYVQARGAGNRSRVLDSMEQHSQFLRRCGGRAGHFLVCTGLPTWHPALAKAPDMPKTHAETIWIADAYALGDPTQPALDSVGEAWRQPVNNRLGPLRPSDRHEYGYKRSDPDYRYGADKVAAVNLDHPEAGESQKPKNEGQAWRPNQNSWLKKEWNGSNVPPTFEVMLDGPYRYHTTDPRKPANHSTRNCSWHHRIQVEGQRGKF